jgi:hypothetical protein
MHAHIHLTCCQCILQSETPFAVHVQTPDLLPLFASIPRLQPSGSGWPALMRSPEGNRNIASSSQFFHSCKSVLSPEILRCTLLVYLREACSIYVLHFLFVYLHICDPDV